MELPIKTWLLDAVPGLTIGAAVFFVMRDAMSLLLGGAVRSALKVSVGEAFFTAASAVWFGLTQNACAERLVFSTLYRTGARSSWHAAYGDRALVVAAC